MRELTMEGDDFDPFNLKGETKPQVESAPVIIAKENEIGDDVPVLAPNTTFDSFDPFGIAQLLEMRSPPKTETRDAPMSFADFGAESKNETSKVVRAPNSSASLPLPPKIVVKLTLHEEVSSVAKYGRERDGSSEVSIEGSVFAQVQCSDALKNAPFGLVLTSPPTGSNPVVHVRPHKYFAEASKKTNTQIIKVPKNEIGFVPVSYYSLTDDVQHMPILLERKVTIHDTSCRIAVQVRSKLTNRGDLQDFTIAVAVPEHVDSNSVEIVRGDGVWDGLKRTIKWKLDRLNKGESFMVSAQATLWKVCQEGEEIRFPVLMRCSSPADLISNVDFQAVEAEGHPASVAFNKVYSFRLLHRLT